MISEEIKEKFVTPAEAAAILHKTKATLANLRYYRKGPNYHKVGQRILYSVNDLNNYLDSCRVEIEG